MWRRVVEIRRARWRVGRVGRRDTIDGWCGGEIWIVDGGLEVEDVVVVLNASFDFDLADLV